MKALKAVSRSALCLQACNGPDLVTTHTLAASMGWTTHVASTTLSQARAQGHIELVESKLHGQSTFKITADGKRRLAQITPATTQPDDRELERRAFDMVIAHANGCDSEQLAEKLGTTPEVIDRLLSLHVEQHRLVTCGVWRGGVTFLQYHASAGSTLVYDWSAFRSLSTPTSSQKKLRITPPAPAPEPSLRQQIAAKEKAAAKPAVASEVVDAAKPKLEFNFRGFPFVGELDIDAVHRKLQDAPSASAAPATGLLQDFLCYVDSDGDTYIHSNGEQIELPAAHTRMLMKYFALINAASMVMEPAGASA